MYKYRRIFAQITEEGKKDLEKDFHSLVLPGLAAVKQALGEEVRQIGGMPNFDYFLYKLDMIDGRRSAYKFSAKINGQRVHVEVEIDESIDGKLVFDCYVKAWGKNEREAFGNAKQIGLNEIERLKATIQEMTKELGPGIEEIERQRQQVIDQNKRQQNEPIQ